MKFTSIFFTASAIYIRGLPQIYAKTSEKYEARFNIFHSKCNLYSKFTSNIRKNERSTKFTTIFHSEP